MRRPGRALLAWALLALAAPPAARPQGQRPAPPAAGARPAGGPADSAAYARGLEERRAALREALVARAVERLELQRRGREGDPSVDDSLVLGRTRRLTPLDAALLIRSGRAPAEGNRILREEAAAPFRMGMFYLHDIVAALLLAGEGVEPATSQAIRESLRVQPLYRGDTENHWVLYHTGLYLAAGLWSDEDGPAWFNGRSSAENAADGRAFLEHWARRTVTEGQGEFDSPNYLGTFLAPLLTLEAFAPDEEVRRLAAGMLTWLLADYAAESVAGLYGGGHSRDYPEHATRPGSAPNAGWGWLYFGAGAPAHGAEYLEVPALGTWAPPELLRDIALDRAEPYEQRERKRVRDVIRYGELRSPPVFKTAWVTSAFVLGSLQGGVLQPIQQHTWDVTFPDARGGGAIFTLHPYYSGRELATFFPEEPEWLTDQVNRFHTNYTDPGKWVSSSPWERVFQHRGALIALYDVPDSARHGHIDGFFPRTLARREESGGWVFARGGDAFVAVRVLRPFEWREEPEGWRARSPYRRNAVVVEVAPAGEHPSFEAFRDRVLRSPLAATLDEGPVRVRYVSLAGDTLEFAFPADRRLNGRPVDLASTPLFSGPHVRAEPGRMELRHGGRVLVVAPFGEAAGDSAVP